MIEKEGNPFIGWIERIDAIRSALRISKTKNIAFVDYITSDGVGTMTAASGLFTHPGAVGLPSPTRYVPTSTGRNNRETDSERKLYENLALRFKNTTKGLTRLVSELEICISCAGIGRQFKQDFSGVVSFARGDVGYTSGRKR